MRRNIAVAPLLALSLIGCKDDSSLDNETNNQSDFASISIQERSLTQNSQCEYGGKLIETGFDVDGDGRLSSEEILKEYEVCNGAPGLPSLVAMDRIEDLSDCPAGGVTISSGPDINGNAELDSGEIVKTVSVCDANPFSSTGDGYTSLVIMESLDSNEICPEGGSKILSGLDTDKNLELDSFEVISTEYLCNGISQEPYKAIANSESFLSSDECPNGGMQISTGTDINRNNVLDNNEIFDVSELCHGTAGQDGDHGLEVLMQSVIIEVGGVCTTGGVKVTTGLDSNRNQVLDIGEITDAFDVCNGATGIAINALVKTAVEPSGQNCTKGGIKVSSGLDLDRSQSLDISEIESLSYVCNGDSGSDGIDGFNYEISLAQESAGENCESGGTKVSTGLDINRSGTLESNEISKSYFVCNGIKGETGLDVQLPDTHTLSVSEVVPFDFNQYPECHGANNSTAIRSTYYSSEDTSFSNPLQTCTQSSCVNEIINGKVTVNSNQGTAGCYETNKINYLCDEGSYFDSALKSCIASNEQCEIHSCETEVSCLASGGNWQNNMCLALCPVGLVSTTRGCEAPIAERCSVKSEVVDNLCVEMENPTIITGGTLESPVNLCGSYSEGLVLEGRTYVKFTCSTTIDGPFHAEDASIYNKDESSTVIIKQPRLKRATFFLGNWVIEGQEDIVDPFFGTAGGYYVRGRFRDVNDVKISNILLGASFLEYNTHAPDGSFISIDNVVSIDSSFTNLSSLALTNSISINDSFATKTVFSGIMINPNVSRSTSGYAKPPHHLTRIQRGDADETPHWTNRRNWGDVLIQTRDKGFEERECVGMKNCATRVYTDLSTYQSYSRAVSSAVGETMELSIMCFDVNGPYMGRCTTKNKSAFHEIYQDNKWSDSYVPVEDITFTPNFSSDFHVNHYLVLDGEQTSSRYKVTVEAR